RGSPHGYMRPRAAFPLLRVLHALICLVRDAGLVREPAFTRLGSHVTLHLGAAPAVEQAAPEGHVAARRCPRRVAKHVTDCEESLGRDNRYPVSGANYLVRVRRSHQPGKTRIGQDVSHRRIEPPAAERNLFPVTVTVGPAREPRLNSPASPVPGYCRDRSPREDMR